MKPSGRVEVQSSSLLFQFLFLLFECLVLLLLQRFGLRLQPDLLGFLVLPCAFFPPDLHFRGVCLFRFAPSRLLLGCSGFADFLAPDLAHRVLRGGHELFDVGVHI